MIQPVFVVDVSRKWRKSSVSPWSSEEAGEIDVSHLPRMRPVSQPQPL
jgi:hypothetical protein